MWQGAGGLSGEPPHPLLPPDGHVPDCVGGGAGAAHQAGAPHHQGPWPCLWEVREDPPTHPAEGEEAVENGGQVEPEAPAPQGPEETLDCFLH